MSRSARTTHALLALIACALASCGGKQPAPKSPPPTGGGSGSAVVSTAPPAVDDPALLTCKTVSEQPPGVCGVLESAPRADVSSAAVKHTVDIWNRLEAPFHAMTGRESALVVLSPDARTGDGTPIPPAAYICPGPKPTVYVPATLLALVDNNDANKFPDDFLAFVIGHELGHRMNDLTADGCQLAAFQRPGKGVDEEELADARSAFFITSAGFSASKIAREDMVTKFLEAEYKLRPDDTKTRKTALLGALARFDSYEALYQTALELALMGNMEAADRLLTWADELVQSHGVPLPELRVMRAITRIHRAAEMAPWLGKDLGMPVGIDTLRCTAIHPGHSGLYEEPSKAVRGPDVERGRKLLKEALVLLGEAEARGATPFTVSTARACANLYLADATAADEAQSRAEALVPANAPAAVTDALHDNRALVVFLAYAKQHPPPVPEKGDELTKWTDDLVATLGAQGIRAGLGYIVTLLRDPLGKKPAPPDTGPTCSGAKPPAAPAFTALPPIGTHGSCPSGTTLAYALPSLSAAKNTGTTQGMTVCRPTSGDGDITFVRLTSTTEPPLKGLERTMRSSRPAPALASLDAWVCQCAAVERQGVSDRGEVAYLAQCPSLKLDSAVLIVVDGKVQQVIQTSR